MSIVYKNRRERAMVVHCSRISRKIDSTALVPTRLNWSACRVKYSEPRAGRQGVLGLRVLERFNVIFDYPRNWMILEKRSRSTDR